MKSRLKNYLVGCFLILLGGLVFGLVLLADSLFPTPDSLLAWLLQASFALAAIGIAFYLMIKGAKWLKRDAEAVLERDTRRPIVYLRSFESERNEAFINRVFNVKELYLARILKSLGPVVTVGEPSETLPNLGAARVYFQDADWQQGVTRLIAESQYVVFRAGTSGGLLWELGHIIANCEPTKFLFFFPDGEGGGAYGEFKRRADDVLPRPLPDNLEAPKTVNFICFDDNWAPINLQPWYWRDSKNRRFPTVTRSIHYYYDMLIAIKPFLLSHKNLPLRILASIWFVYLVAIARIVFLLVPIFAALIFWW